MPRLATFAIFGVLAAGGTAAAQNARFPRPIIAPAVKLSDRVRPLQPRPPAVKPTFDGDSMLSIEGVARPPRGEQEQILVQLIANTPDSEVEEKADYYFRLGELHASQQRQWRKRAAELTAGQGRPADIQVAANKAKEAFLKSVKVFKALVDNDAFRNYPKLDVALFEYGYVLESGKYMAEARAVFDKLLKNFPSSKYVPEAHLVFGEYFLDAHQLADAEARYRMVLKFPKSSVYWFAMLRLGQVHHELNRFQEALETYFQVVQATKNDAKLETLHREAEAGFARAYAPIGKPDKALAAFQRVDPKTAVDALELLADTYVASGAFDKAIVVYRQLASQPGHACHAQYTIAHAMLSMPGPDATDKVDEIERLVRTAKALDPAAGEAAECRANALAMTGELARAFHAEATKTKNPATVDLAERLYAAELDAFPDAAADTRSLYAELLWFRADLERDATARARTWERAADAFAAIPTKDAAAAAVLAWRNALDLDAPEILAGEIDLAKARAASAQRRAIPPHDVKILAAFDAYAQYATDPDDELITAIVLRRYRHDDKTVVILTSFLEHHRDHASAELAANLLLEALIYLKRYDDVLATVDKLSADPHFVDGKPRLKRNIEFLRSRSLRSP